MAQAEVRRVVNLVGETGTADREEVVYQLGAVIEGGWVPFLTKSEGYTLHLANTNQEQSGQSDQPPAPGTQPDSGTASNTTPQDTTPQDTTPLSDQPEQDTPTDTTSQ